MIFERSMGFPSYRLCDGLFSVFDAFGFVLDMSVWFYSASDFGKEEGCIKTSQFPFPVTLGNNSEIICSFFPSSFPPSVFIWMCALYGIWIMIW